MHDIIRNNPLFKTTGAWGYRTSLALGGSGNQVSISPLSSQCEENEQLTHAVWAQPHCMEKKIPQSWALILLNFANKPCLPFSHSLAQLIIKEKSLKMKRHLMSLAIQVLLAETRSSAIN